MSLDEAVETVVRQAHDLSREQVKRIRDAFWERDSRAIQLQVAKLLGIGLDELKAKLDEMAERESQPHIGLPGGMCVYCGTRLDLANRGRTCPKREDA